MKYNWGNRGNKIMSKKIIEFVSYDGEWPNLCRGTLVIQVKEYVEDFGCDEAEDFESSNEEKHAGFKEYELKSILCSGGSCGFSDDYSQSHIEQEPWYIHKNDLPDELKPYKKEIEEIINENIPWGCLDFLSKK